MRLFSLFLSSSLVLACGAATSTPRCTDAQCPANTTCDEARGVCVASEVPGCSGTCTGTTPVCDAAAHACVTCTPTEGCSGLMPYCNTNVAGGRCVECLEDAHCPGSVCQRSTRTCKPVAEDAGVDAGVSACATSCTGARPYCDDASRTCVACLTDQQCAGSRACDLATHTCVLQPSDGGVCVNTPAPPACTTTCAEGFTCVAGSCVLNGGGGPVQVTLRWDSDTDVDLHLDEPLPNGGWCEIFYGDDNVGGTSSCGAVGSLDLDSNAGCSIDGVNIENIIYPAGTPAPSGTYRVRVDYYEACSVTQAIPYELEVRVNGGTTGWCDVFQASDADQGSTGAGRLVTTFVVP